VVDVIKDYANTRLGLLLTNKDYSLDSPKSIKVFENMLETVNNYEASKEGLTGRKLANLILGILNYKRSIVTDKSKIVYDDEYMQLAEAYMHLVSIDKLSELNVSKLSVIETWVQTADRYDDDYRNFVLEQINIAIRKAVEIEYAFTSKNDIEVRKLDTHAKALSIYGDKSKDLFEPLFIKQEVQVIGVDGEYTGESKTVSIGEIHWDENSPETKRALNDPHNPIDMNYVNYGKHLMNEFEKEFIEYAKHKYRKKWLKGYEDKTKEEQEEVLLENAKKHVAQRWKKGMIPAITRRASAALEDGDKKEAFDLWMKNVGRQEGAFDEYFEGDETTGTIERYNSTKKSIL